MGIPINAVQVHDILQAKIFLSSLDLTWQGLSVLNYHCHTGEASWIKDNALAFYTQLRSEVIDVLATQACDEIQYTSAELQVHRFGSSPSVVWEFPEAIDTEVGAKAKGVGEGLQHSGAACLIRKSFRTGRTAMGRFFFGPLLDRFTNGDILIPDPPALGDLEDVRSALHVELPVTMGVGNVLLFRPAIVGFTMTDGERRLKRAAEDIDEVRVQNWSPLVSHLHSRRAGVGM